MKPDSYEVWKKRVRRVGNILVLDGCQVTEKELPERYEKYKDSFKKG